MSFPQPRATQSPTRLIDYNSSSTCPESRLLVQLIIAHIKTKKTGNINTDQILGFYMQLTIDVTYGGLLLTFSSVASSISHSCMHELVSKTTNSFPHHSYIAVATFCFI